MFTPIVKSNYALYNPSKGKASVPQKGLKNSSKKIHSSPALSGLMQSGDRLGSRTTVSLNQLYLAKNRPKAKVVNPQLRTISEGPERPQICSVPRRCASVDDSGNQTSVTGSSNCSSNESVSASKSAKNDNEETTKNPIAQLIRSIRRLSTKGRSSGGHSESDPEAMLSCSPANDRQLESSK